VTVSDLIRPAWHDRETPLEAAAVVARGGAVSGLARSAQARLRAGATLGAAVGGPYLVVIGDDVNLPWSDGAVYLGWEATMLVPTTLEPRPRTALLSAAARRFAGAHDLVILLPHMVLHTHNPRPLTDAGQLARLVS